MHSSDVFALQRSELNDFLFAIVGTERNGMTLSLVSAFARLGSDPWREARRLAGLPKLEAIDSLALTIAGMPASIWTLPDATTIAARLVALLPTRSGSPEPGPSTHGGQAARFVRIVLLLAGVALGMAYALGLFTTRDAPKLDGSDVSAFTPTGPHAPPS